MVIAYHLLDGVLSAVMPQSKLVYNEVSSTREEWRVKIMIGRSQCNLHLECIVMAGNISSVHGALAHGHAAHGHEARGHAAHGHVAHECS